MVSLEKYLTKQKTDPAENPHLYDWKRPLPYKDDVKALKQFIKGIRITKSKIATWRQDSFRVRSGGYKSDKNQRVMFKMTYSSSIMAHKAYLKLYLPQIIKDEVVEKPDSFGTPIEEYEKHIVPLHFKCIISPENQNINLRELASCFINKLEARTGYEFYWMGCIHKDTDHKHVHIAINGKDKHGKKIRFPKDLIKTQIRDMLSDIATDMIGERTPEEIWKARENIAVSRRWTEYDEKLKNAGNRIYMPALATNYAKRLSFLSSINLAERDGDFYTLKKDFEEVLKATGRYNNYLSEYLKPDPLPLRIFEGGSITGKVDKVITFDKDESWNDAIIIRKDKERIYIPVYQLKKQNLTGKIIRIEDSKGGINRSVSDKDIKIIRTYEIAR